ncbi:hypothetical protein FBU59_000002 [Linderina macrospora]|uniref:Uncharacterized protein n=1 Tax=Linderina macrospora TaxID=4868 RepID=A0ACC1JI90_9FUNG|nr:hypothetical protein FBU59_000002 [Linderina macrospora]
MDPDLIHDSYTINDLAELLDNVKLVNTKNGHIIDHSAASPSNRDASVFDEYYSDISNDEDPDDVDDI